MNAFGLAPLIIFLPALGVVLNGFFGGDFLKYDRKIGERWSGWFASAIALASFAVAVLLAMSLSANGHEAQTIFLLDWISIPSAGFEVPWAMRVDTLSVTMMLVVSGVGSLIHIYAIGYMHGDRDFTRFFTYLNLFLFFMLILVSGSSYLALFVGWEGVGLCSYLLIGFWFDRLDEEGRAANATAARKAFVVNRIGDFGMILAMILLFWTFGSLGFEQVFTSAEELFAAGHMVDIFGAQLSVGTVLTAVTALFLLGAAGKSAQIPLYVWLPDAMAGPTPVSALIHAATMVTAGIYLIARSNVLFEIVRASEEALFAGLTAPDLVAYAGAATALLAGLIAFTQFDIKKVLAYSTISQLGFMIAAVGMGAYVAGMFHLVTHAFFKALLFLSAGSVIHGMEHGHHHLHHDDHGGDDFDPQDMRFMGNLRQRMPWTFAVYLIGSLALAGVAPLAGFWSKDEILAHAATNEGTAFTIVYWLLTLAAICTAFYMGRQLMMVFFGKARHEAAEHAEESSPVMVAPLVILAALSVLGGLLNLPYFSQGAAEAAEAAHDYGVNLALEHWLEYSIASFELSEGPEALLHMPHTPITVQWDVAIISTVLALAALGLAMLVVYRRRPQTVDEPDPLAGTPIWWFRVLPLNTFYYSVLVAGFNRSAAWLGHRLDWDFWHDFVHDRVIRDSFVGGSRWLMDRFDRGVIDGFLVEGSGRAAAWLGQQLRGVQTGYVRNYALAVFLGVIALLAFFVLAG
ncbi:MAG: NADH-quinone oxidoreductase subunit L [Candidatus Promineifilaceae bacterium]|nr:NADH-quinone oxidoreductase subunit L [Candidatus Promineifilaceae bacterium]